MVVASALLLVWVLPLIWAIVVSLKSEREVLAYPPSVVFEPTWSNYVDALFGDFSIADAMYAPVALRFRTYGINLPESAAYYPQRLLQSTAMQEWLAAAEVEIEVIDHDEVGR